MWFPESVFDSTAFSNQIHVPVLVRGTFAGRRNVRKACKISDTQMHVKALQLIFKFVSGKRPAHYKNEQSRKWRVNE